MGTHAADFGPARKAEAFAGHRGEATVDADAHEAAHAVRAGEERAGLGELGQR